MILLNTSPAPRVCPELGRTTGSSVLWTIVLIGNIPEATMRLHTYVRQTFLACLLLALFTACSSTQPADSPSTQSRLREIRVCSAPVRDGTRSLSEDVSCRPAVGADVKPFRLQSAYTADAPTSDGKAGLWRASFASPSKRMMKMFVWSGLVGPDAPEKGVTFTAEDSWSSSNSATQVFDLGFLKVDSSQAYDVAQQHGGESCSRKMPSSPYSSCSTGMAARTHSCGTWSMGRT